jgi:short-subunit dehydrogenase
MNNKLNWLVVGSSGGIGKACVKFLQQHDHAVTGIDRSCLDLEDFDSVMAFDLTSYDVVINAVGHTKGTYQGFLGNNYRNIISQINTNMIGNLLLAKNYATTRLSGRYVWISSSVLDSARPFHGVYGSSKAGSKFALDLVRQEATHIDITEVKVGLVKTKFRYHNYCGTRTQEQVDQEYAQNNARDPDTVAEQIIKSVMDNQSFVNIT